MRDVKKHKIFIANENICIDLYEGEHIVKAVSRYDGTHKMNGCNNGGCGICRIKVNSGDYTIGKMSKRHVSDEDIENGIVLGCRVYPKSDMEIEYLGYKK